MEKFYKKPLRIIKKVIRAVPVFMDGEFFRTDPDGKKEVFIMISSFSRGGAQRVASVLASELSKKYHVTAVTRKIVEDTYPLDSNVEVIRIPAEKLSFELFKAYVRLLKICRKPIVSISFMFDSNRMNTWGGGKCKIICSERNNPAKKMPERFDDTVMQYRMADHVVFQSETVRSLYDEEIRSHSSVLPNPVSVACYASLDTKHRIVTAGRLHPQKNQAMLIRAFVKFLKDHPEYTLSIYGSGELESELRELSAELSAESSVLFHGNVENIHPEIADAEMFVLSSDYEGLSNALLEAMMMGIPCISTACEGSTDVIRSGENGILVPVGDEDELCRAMCALADDGNKRKEIACEGRKTGEGFRKEKVAEKWIEMIERVAAE